MSSDRLLDALGARLAQLYPGARVTKVRALGDDEGIDGHTKAHGYGRGLRVTLETGHEVVFHMIRSDQFGHDRRADRIANAVLAHDTFGQIPHHVPVVDVGVIDADGGLRTLMATGEPYFVTAWREGSLYADDLRAVAARGRAEELDLARVDALVDVLLEIHRSPGTHPEAYTRSIRDLLGSGEGIFGLIDSFDDDTPGAPADRLLRIERGCQTWRWRLRRRVERLRRIHGDFHPYNILFERTTDVTLLDASRGAEGDPADDVACLAINFLCFGLGSGGKHALAQLWTRFWDRYLAMAQLDVLPAVAPFFAWRGLVLASPRWYPDVAPADRERILDFIERGLANDRFDPAWGLEMLR